MKNNRKSNNTTQNEALHTIKNNTIRTQLQQCINNNCYVDKFDNEKPTAFPNYRLYGNLVYFFFLAYTFPYVASMVVQAQFIALIYEIDLRFQEINRLRDFTFTTLFVAILSN